MNGKQFHTNKKEMLRSPERLAPLEVTRVVDLCLEGINVSSVLDVGTGTGVFAEAFIPFASEVVGIDLSPEMIEAAKGYVPTARFEQAGVESIPAEDDAFDVVFLGLVLHETDDPLAALMEARRCAKTRVAALEWFYQEEEMGPPIDHRLKPDEVARLAQKAGFQNFESIPLAHLVLYRFSI